MITANFSGLPSGEVLRLSDKLWQYDTGQQLKIQGLSGIDENTEVHFALKYTNRAIVKTGEFNSGNSTLTVDIPNLFLAYADGVPGKVWVHLRNNETSAHTIREIQIPVEPRKKPDGYISPEDPSDRSFIETIVDEHITAYDAVLKDYVDGELDAIDEAKADKTEVATVAERVMSLIPVIAGKADKSDTYTIQGTDTAIANAVTGLVSENSLPLVSVKRTSTDLNSEQINSICTVMSDTANRPTGVMGICLTLGTTRDGGVIAQLILSTTSKIYLRYKAGNGAVYGAWKECASAQELAQLRDESAQELEQFREELVNEGTNLLYLPDGTFEQSSTGNIKAVIKDQVITLSGTANGSTGAFVNIPISVNMEAETYTLKRFLDDAKFAVMLTKDTSSTGISTVSAGDATKPNYNTVTLSATVTAKYIRIYVPPTLAAGTSVAAKFQLQLKKSSTVPNAWESPVLLKNFLMPGLPLMSTLGKSTDLNNEQINSICTVMSDTANRPDGVIGICLTLGTTVSGGVKAQLILSTASKIFLRYKAGNGAVYTGWSEIGAGQGSQPEVKVPPAIDAFGIFDTVGFIGDSLGSGWADANGELTKDDPTLNKNDYDVSWIQFLCRKTGRTGYNFSYGGATTNTWFNNSRGAALLRTDGYKCQAYIIGLGVNDSRIDSTIDPPASPVSPEAFSANYANIINTIRSVSEKAPIFCIKIPKDDIGAYANVSAYNTAISNIVSNNAGNSVYLIEPEVAKINSLFNQYKDIYHYSALGYARIAEYMLELLNACVEENKGDFVQLNLLESDPKEYYTKAEVDALIESLRNELSNS